MSGQSVQAKQDKYSTNAKLAYGLSRKEEKMRLLSYMQKNQSAGHDRYVFYKTGVLEAQDQENNYDGTNKNYTDLKGVDITDFVTSVVAIPTPQDCPIYRKKDEDLKSNLDINSPLMKTQMSALTKKTIGKILKPLKDATTGSVSVIKKDGTTATLTIPAENIFGDSTKTFYELESEFFSMLSSAESMATGEGSDSSIAMVYGTSTNAILKQYHRTSNRDFITTDDFEKKDGTKMAIKKFDVAEMIPIREFDEFVGAGFIVCMLTDAFGYDSNGEPDVESDYIKQKRSNFYNLTEHNACTLVDERGVFIFKFLGTMGTPASLEPATLTRTGLKK